MEFYEKELFIPEGIEIVYASLIQKKETLEYKLNFIEDQIIDIKKKHFKELFMYENMKKTNPNIVPNKVILAQFKTLEKDPTYLEFKKEIENYKSQIKTIENKLKLAQERTENNFSFKNENIKIYLNMAVEILENKNENALDRLFLEIFNNEFNNKKLYYNIKWTHNYDIYGLIVERAPKAYQDFFFAVIDYRIKLDKLFRDEYFKKYPNDDLMDLMIEYRIQYEREMQ